MEKQATEEERKLKKKLNTRFQNLEAELEKVKQEKAELENKLGDPAVYGNAGQFQKTLQNFNEVETKLKSLTKEWEEVFEQLAGLQ